MTQIDYLTPDRLPRRPLTSVRLTVGFYILVFMILCVFGLVVPRFEQIFKDFKTELPALTRLVLTFSRWCNDEYGWVWLLLAPAVVPIVVTQLFWRPLSPQESFRRTVAAILIVFGLIVLFTAGTVVALFLPMMSLIQSVSSPAGHK